MRASSSTWSLLTLLPPLIRAACFDITPAFPPPSYSSADPILLDAFARISESIFSVVSSPKHNTSSFSVEVTSTTSTLWSYHHTARELNETRPGANPVDGSSVYRIASITKTFTVLALLQLHSAGNLSLDDPVIKYLPHLHGTLPWKDITLRILATQLSGLPRDWTGSQGDVLTEIPDAWRFGLPPLSEPDPDLPHCYSYGHSFVPPCNESDLYEAVAKLSPVTAPNALSSYSNMAFEILGLVITHVSGFDYESYIQRHILTPIGMHSSSFNPGPDAHAVLPKGSAWFWDVDEGIHNPTGGLRSSTNDLSLYLRYALTHFNTFATGINWFQPASFSFGGESAYGMPWEIFHTTHLLEDSSRPVTFYTKGGGEPGYISNIIIAPDYGLGFTVLTAGSNEVVGELMESIREIVTVGMVRAAEELAAKQVERKYVGRYVAEEGLNSSLELRYSMMDGLVVERFISNGTDVRQSFGLLQPSLRNKRTKAQLFPTLLYVDEEKNEGEKWRFLVVPPRKEEGKRGVWDEFCISDVDVLMYDGKPLNEVVFWEGEDGRVEKVGLSAFRAELKREAEDEDESELFVQDL